ncbi:MAG: rhodanese-like domain-containing protein [Dehalococcoidia bacterium]|nr:rhodanese-like domain-containing protein [Dehalococcoidia bacterium]MDD5493408.1 rhodanese-like domain-containing protein [Dehalococcoidia bacterium]
MKESQSIVVLVYALVVVVIVTAGFIFQRQPVEIERTYLTPQEAKQMIDQSGDLIIIDASRYFYEKGHLPGALNYPKCAFESAISGLDKSKTYLIYCHGFGSPALSAYRLKDAGFDKVYTLLGNYGAWVDAGYPIEN